MRALLVQLRSPAIVSAVLVLPFALLEVIRAQGITAHFPVPLFVALWLLALTFSVMLLRLVRSLQMEHSFPVLLYRQLPAIALMIVAAGLWVGLVVDQMPCFLGVPNCD